MPLCQQPLVAYSVTNRHQPRQQAATVRLWPSTVRPSLPPTQSPSGLHRLLSPPTRVTALGGDCLRRRVRRRLADRRLRGVPDGAVWGEGAEPVVLGGGEATASSQSFGPVSAGLLYWRVV